MPAHRLARRAAALHHKLSRAAALARFRPVTLTGPATRQVPAAGGHAVERVDLRPDLRGASISPPCAQEARQQ